VNGFSPETASLQYTTIMTVALRVARVCERIVEHIAGVEDYQVALVTYRAASERLPGTPINARSLWNIMAGCLTA
jgi:hypothetical protein